MKKNYETPKIELIEVKIEKGFAVSPGQEQLEGVKEGFGTDWN